MKIAVRLDDITPDMDWERFLKFKSLLDRYQVKPLIGVVPQNRDPNLVRKGSSGEGAGKSGENGGGRADGKAFSPRAERAEGDTGTGMDGKSDSTGPERFWDYIKALEEAGWVIAMHGCYHIYATDRGGIFPLNNFSEFAGLPLERQKELLGEGKRLLGERGLETGIFMAPAHSYDYNTLRALKETGFEALTDGFGNSPYRWKGLDFYPISFLLGRTLNGKKGYSTMVVHTNTVSDADLKQYEENFKRKDISWISYGEYLRAAKKRRTLPGRWREFLMAKGKYFVVKLLAR